MDAGNWGSCPKIKKEGENDARDICFINQYPMANHGNCMS
jgi:hypothetical protein